VIFDPTEPAMIAGFFLLCTYIL